MTVDRLRSPAMSAAIAVVAHKGGAGKTLLVANLAAALVGEGAGVLAVDADPQGALGAALGIRPTKPTLYEVLADRAGTGDAIETTALDRLDVLPADLDLAGAEVELTRRPDWQPILRHALDPTRDEYDLLLIDSAPGLGVLPYAALVAADAALVTCPADFLAFRALPTLLEAIDRARELVPGMRPLGIVPMFTGTRTRHEADVLAELRDRHGELLLPAIPRRVVVADAALAGEPITVYAPYSEAAEAFAALAKEVRRRAETL
jgi:chromosome partitioning protein